MNMAKKILSIVMCIMLILPFAVMYVSAREPHIETRKSDYVEIAKLPEDILDAPVKSEARKSVKSAVRGVSSANDPYTFYSTLSSDMERLIYNGIVEHNAGLDSVDDSSSSAAEISITSTDSIFLFSDQAGYDALWDAVDAAISPAVACVIEDNPKFFWLSGYSVGLNYEYYGNAFRGIIEVSLGLNNTDAYPNWGVVRNYYNNLLDSVASFKVEGNNRYQKVKSIHDTICSMVTYDPNYDNSNKNPTNHEPVAVFNSPYLTVCEGYSEAFKLICDRERIPCITVIGLGNGGAHKWAYVKMDDGNWYGMDVTWDDQDSYCFYDYFLAGSTSKAVNFGTGTFSSEHVPTGQVFTSGSYTLTYPTLSNVSYVTGLPRNNTKTTFDAVNGFMYISKDAVLTSQFASSSDFTVNISGKSTGATVRVTNTNSSAKTYTVVRWGDVDGDTNGAVTRNGDYNTMKNVVKGTSSLTEGTAKFRAADFDGDGAIDAFDLYDMDRYLNGLDNR